MIIARIILITIGGALMFLLPRIFLLYKSMFASWLAWSGIQEPVYNAVPFAGTGAIATFILAGLLIAAGCMKKVPSA